MRTRLFSNVRVAKAAMGVLVVVGVTASAQTTQPSNATAAPSANASRQVPTNATAQQQQPQEQYSFRDRYTVLADHNIFLKDRAAARERERERANGGGGATTQPGARPRTTEQSYVLTGVVLEGGERRAYFEDLNRGGLIKVGVGDTLGRGKVADIDIDAVAYAQDDRPQVWVNVGSDLTGTASTAVASSSSGSSPTTAPAIDPNSPNLTVAQRMMLRRQQEQQKMRR